MNKSELIEAVTALSNITKAQTALMLDELINVIQKSLVDGNHMHMFVDTAAHCR